MRKVILRIPRGNQSTIRARFEIAQMFNALGAIVVGRVFCGHRFVRIFDSKANLQTSGKPVVRAASACNPSTGSAAANRSGRADACSITRPLQADRVPYSRIA